MTSGVPNSLERLSHADLIGVVRDLIGEVGLLRAENEKVNFALTQRKAEHQAVKDELARLKNLPPRAPHKPSGMEGDGPQRTRVLADIKGLGWPTVRKRVIGR